MNGHGNYSFGDDTFHLLTPSWNIIGVYTLFLCVRWIGKRRIIITISHHHHRTLDMWASGRKL